MTTYGYVRVSTDYQDYEAQKAAIEKRFKIDVWVEDMGTGRMTQPNLKNLVLSCTDQDQVIVYAFDRLGRKVQNVLEIVSCFKMKNVSLTSIREGVDLKTPAGSMMFHVLCSMAEFESSIIADRVKAGLQAARNRGVVLGPPRKDSTEQGQKALRYAKQLRGSGMAIRMIQKTLKQQMNFKISVGTLSTFFNGQL